jgi:hypothetical protein
MVLLFYYAFPLLWLVVMSNYSTINAKQKSIFFTFTDASYCIQYQIYRVLNRMWYCYKLVEIDAVKFSNRLWWTGEGRDS